MIVFSSVTKKFHGQTVLENISFTVQPGEFVCLTGPSGAGKSTIVHLLIRGELPTSGKIEVDGADLAMLPRPILQMYRRKTGVLFQDYKLLSDRTVAENIAFALEVSDVRDEDIKERTEELLKQLRLSHRRDAFPSELSGGEKTRTALARALSARPNILIADEPTGNIDPVQSLEILNLLREINKQGATVILASHDQRVIDTLNVRVLRLENGKIVRDSVGGYDAPSPVRTNELFVASRPVQKTEVPPPVIEVAKESPPVVTESAPPAEKKSQSPGKIRPIAI